MNSKTLIGIVTFGNLPFTQLTIRALRKNTKRAVDFFVIVGKPGDTDTEEWLKAENIPHLAHEVNKGFPASLNDIYTFAWKGFGPSPWQDAAYACRPDHPDDYDHLIIAGNDIVPYPRAVDALMETAETTDYEWVASSQLDVESLCRFHPEVIQHFGSESGNFDEARGKNFPFEHWDLRRRRGEGCLECQTMGNSCPEHGHIREYVPLVRPWEIHTDFRPPSIEPNAMRDCHNLCLFKRSVAEKIGYIDVNFFPAYFSDNDYNRRAMLAGVKGCTLPHAAYFHFWSRTIHQGSGGSNATFYSNNAQYYREKWGGLPGDEAFTVPFNGAKWCPGHGLSTAILAEGVASDAIILNSMQPDLKIAGRENEAECVDYWKGQSKPIFGAIFGARVKTRWRRWLWVLGRA